jgi:hypothetical protein
MNSKKIVIIQGPIENKFARSHAIGSEFNVKIPDVGDNLNIYIYPQDGATILRSGAQPSNNLNLNLNFTQPWMLAPIHWQVDILTLTT